jgi:hypothetical protein
VAELSLEHRVAILERQMKSVRRGQQQNAEWLDTVCSPLWKRVWWFVCGYRFYRVGRWYGKTEDLR